MSMLKIDDELDEEKDILRNVGKARDIPVIFEDCPQAFLEASHHPYAPFTGDTLLWTSLVWDDATTFEGLTRDGNPHGKGVVTFGKQGRAAGFRDTKAGDMYEGEFAGGFGHGVGMFTGAEGTVFKGEYTAGSRDGCGVEYNLKPWYDRMRQGMTPTKAWKQVKAEVQENIVLGTWNNGTFVSGPSDLGNACSLGDIQKMMYESDSVVARARMFAFKPGGAAAFYKSHLNGIPIRTLQHPLHYPHGTLFMAPGPAGQTAALPNDKGLKKLMLREFNNYRIIHSSYNFDYEPSSDSLMGKALRWWNKQERLRKREDAIQDKIANREMRKLQGESTPAGATTTKGKTGTKGKGSRSRKASKEGDDDGFDESDLLADAAAIIAANNSATARLPGGSAFGSISMSRRHPQARLQDWFVNIAKRAPRMPRLGGPREQQ